MTTPSKHCVILNRTSSDNITIIIDSTRGSSTLYINLIIVFMIWYATPP